MGAKGAALENLKSFWNGLDWSVLTNILVSVIPALLCITLHELAHGFVAYKLGDDTAKKMGRLTLNPIKHIDVFGLVMMVVFKFGWAKPVPVDMRKFRHPKRDMAITAAAGPLCNVVLTCVLLFVYGLIFYPLSRAETQLADLVLQTVLTAAYLSIALAIFNIIPIPPLDGSKVLFSFLSEKNYWRLMRYERYGMIILLIAVATDVLGTPLSNVTGAVFQFLFGIAQFSYELVMKFAA